LEFLVRRVDCRQCHAVKRERLDWLADNPRFTRRFATRVGRNCRSATVADVAEEFHLDWHAVKELDKEYMREQLERAGAPADAC
jgi:transposase